jgi:hypothetical protein
MDCRVKPGNDEQRGQRISASARWAKSLTSGEIKVHACLKLLRSQQRLEHADDFGAFFIDRRRIEIVDLVVNGDQSSHRSQG